MNSPQVASRFAYAAIAFFIIGMGTAMSQNPPASFPGAPPMSVIVASLAFLSFHFSLLPVVAALPAPEWARGSGYAWIVVDNVIIFLSFFGTASEEIIPLRLGVHLATVTWVFGASMTAGGAIRTVGLLGSVAFLAASFAGPFVGREMAQQIMGPAALLLVVWIGLVGAKLGK